MSRSVVAALASAPTQFRGLHEVPESERSTEPLTDRRGEILLRRRAHVSDSR